MPKGKKLSEVESVISAEVYDAIACNSLDFFGALSELIDNSISAKRKNVPLQITVSFFLNLSNDTYRLEIEDNGIGISPERLPLAIGLANPGENSLNEYGLGLKNSLPRLGKLALLETKCTGDPGICIEGNLGLSTSVYELLDPPFDCGTKFTLVRENSERYAPFDTTNQFFMNMLAYRLGARYRKFLNNGEISITLLKYIDESLSTSHKVDAICPHYYLPDADGGAAKDQAFNEINGRLFSGSINGKEWEARVWIGRAPKEDHEFTKINSTPPPKNKKHPYYVMAYGAPTSGFDLIKDDRVLKHAAWEGWLLTWDDEQQDWRDKGRRNELCRLRGEIELIKGFEATTTKDDILQTEAQKALSISITKLLNSPMPGQTTTYLQYLSKCEKEENIPERIYVLRYKNSTKGWPTPPTSIHSEYDLGGIGMKIDLLIDGIPYEFKAGEVGTQELGQLYLYMLDLGVTKGFLLGRKFTQAVQKYCTKHKSSYDIKLLTYDNVGLNFPLTEDEKKILHPSKATII